MGTAERFTCANSTAAARCMGNVGTPWGQHEIDSSPDSPLGGDYQNVFAARPSTIVRRARARSRILVYSYKMATHVWMAPVGGLTQRSYFIADFF
jgi:hypothetical protein